MFNFKNPFFQFYTDFKQINKTFAQTKLLEIQNSLVVPTVLSVRFIHGCIIVNTTEAVGRRRRWPHS